MYVATTREVYDYERVRERLVEVQSAFGPRTEANSAG